MKALFFVVVVLILMGLLGWINFSHSPNRATISVETKTIKKDLEQTADVVRDAAEKGIEQTKENLSTDSPSQP